MPDLRRMVETVWAGRGRRARTLRVLLSPIEMAYRGAVAMRGWMYDSGLFPAEDFSVAVVSVGNLSVGGTGKTPVAAWIARTLTEKGIKPAIVLRGYGGDETLVHQRLNARVPVIVASDRPRGIRQAIAQGAEVVILDDAFQHRRAARDADVLLVDADSWSGSTRLLPAGPWREPLRSAKRASLVIITRKTADKETVEATRRAVAAAAPQVPIAIVHLTPGDLRSTATGQTLPLHALRGADLTAIAAIARPESFFRQLTELGAVVRPHSFADHHVFTRSEARYLAAQASSSDFVVCTLKDAVKLESIWPAEVGALWYVSQRLKIEDGQPHIDRMLDNLLSIAHTD
ncbi:MAG TPA: tetraacyldisaccharide 4'-kinase [Gemmatimonadaceae bacterium]|nr:tetraacyldisaccharide 4'-kinase [Gemmatimonadaceae bacterium]